MENNIEDIAVADVEQTSVDVKQTKGELVRNRLQAQEQVLLPLLKGDLQQYNKLAAAFSFTIIANGLENCTPLSMVKAFKKCCELNLDPSNGLGKIFLIKYHNKKKGVDEVEAQVGYIGYLDLIMRHREIISNVYSKIVYRGDDFEVEYGNVVKYKHIPRFETKELWLTYAVVHFTDGRIQIEVTNVEDIETSRMKSKGAERYDSPWKMHYNSMAKVVPLRNLAKTLALSINTEDEFLNAADVTPSKAIQSPLLKNVTQDTTIELEAVG